MNINATAFVVLDGQTITCDPYTTTMKQTLQTVNAAWETYTKVQQTAVKDLCEQYTDVTSKWELTNILP